MTSTASYLELGGEEFVNGFPGLGITYLEGLLGEMMVRERRTRSVLSSFLGFFFLQLASLSLTALHKDMSLLPLNIASTYS